MFKLAKKLVYTCLFSTAIIVAAEGAISPASAADIAMPISPVEPESKVGGWTFAVSPYFWAAGLSGDVAEFSIPTQIHVNSDFTDILQNLDFAAMIMGEARYDRYSIFSDLIYSKVSVGSGTPRDVIADSVDVTSETFSGLLAAGYSLLMDGKSSLDIVAGARIWYVGTEISLTGGVLGGRSASDNATWVDGMAGLRGKWYINDKFYLTGWGLVGAGGADIDWDAAAMVGYQFNDYISASAGYRALGVNYNHDGFVFNVVQQGPILALVVHF